jgi:MFS family permease
MTAKSQILWTFAITSIALFMVTLDNLVVTTALPVIRRDLDASLQELEWTVNAYTLSFAVLLLTGAALGDRFGRRRLFVIGLGIFTAASAAAALAGSSNELIAARAIQGLGGAIVMPLTLTILSEAVPPERRGVALGAWGGIGGLAVAIGPLVGGAIVQAISWQWIFWLNVPVGVLLIPLALGRLKETYGPYSRLDLTGLALSGVGLLGIVWGLVRGNDVGWASTEIVVTIAGGAAIFCCSSSGNCAPRRRCCRCGSSATGRLPRRTSPPCSCSSACSAPFSCWRSSCRRCRATRHSAPVSGSCPGRSCRSSSHRSPARSPIASAVAR